MTDLDWLCRPIAHRGLHDCKQGIIENSPSAIKAALEHDYAIEVDLRPDQNNQPIVFHDADLGRLTAEYGPLGARSAEELQKIRYRDSSDQIMSLGALLEMVGGRVPLVIEVKSDWTGPQFEFVRAIGTALEAYRGHAATMSFDPRIMAAFADNFPGIARGIIAERYRDRNYWVMLSWRRRFLLRHLLSSGPARPGFFAYDIQGLPSLAPIAARNLLGFKLLTWTVCSVDERLRAEKWADAMIFEGFRP